jgi:hypothetical protein
VKIASTEKMEKRREERSEENICDVM